MTISQSHDARADEAALLLIGSLIHELIVAGSLAPDRATAAAGIAMGARAEI